MAATVPAKTNFKMPTIAAHAAFVPIGVVTVILGPMLPALWIWPLSTPPPPAMEPPTLTAPMLPLPDARILPLSLPCQHLQLISGSWEWLASVATDLVSALRSPPAT